MAEITVFYDGACPLCVKEIALLRKLDLKRQRIQFEDVSPPGAAAVCPIPQETLLARFHVQKNNGELVDGAEAFTLAYAQIPGLNWVKYIGQFAPSKWLLNLIYSGFLRVRPFLQRLVKNI